MIGEQKPPAVWPTGGTGDDRGTPLRGHGRLVIAAVLALTVAVAVAAFLIGRGVSTPAQQAARAHPPSASLLTAPVVLTHARTTVVLRGTLSDGGAISVGAPGDLSGDLAVVTSVDTGPGAQVQDGSLIAAVAGRPVFVLAGRIPAYSPMSYGTTGIEVSELQAALEATGFGIGTDTAGTYGAGTATAVSDLYQRAGFSPVTAPGPTPAATGGPKSRHRPPPPQYATVPMGEIMFTPSLPVTVVSVAHLGQTVSSDKPLAKLGSGRFTFQAATDMNTASLLKIGATGQATSDLSNGSFPIRLRTKRPGPSPTGGPGYKLTFSPTDQGRAAHFVGQNMALHVSTGQAGGLQWVVPVSAVITNASGGSSVTVLNGTKEVSVPVQAGLAFAGREVVRPVGGGLRPGEQVVIGLGGSR